MGWTGLHRERGTSDLDFFRQEYNDPDNHKVLDAARNGTTVYLAYQSGEEVVGIVVLTQVSRDPYYNFYYKDMDETMGPYEAKCPERILDQLTPTTDENALRWREDCRAYHVERKARPKTRKGDVLVFAQPLVDYAPLAGITRFVLDDPRKNILRVEGSYSRFHVTWWRDRKFTVEKEER